MASELAPILAPLFSAWVRTKQLPPSFAEASVFCIPKTQSPSSGLDYRPISLLNSDYKIFSRVLLNRIRGSLVTTVSPAQFGFVPTRQVHDAIDVWAAMQSLGDRGLLPETATAVLLDFAKAYDTLDRRFLRKALQYHGYDDSLVHAVDAMHLATTARFIADGDLSEVVSVENGIRQGCPLAPVLFILAIDTLYRRAEADPGLTGLWLDDVTRVTLSGYADDTTAYLAHPREGASLLRLLNEFGTVSGLRINISKSHAVALNAAGPQAAHEIMSIPVAARTDHLRHLGASIASAPSPTTIWDAALQQLRGALHLAEIKTTNLLQRIDICNAIIMPKLLFVGRHAWPTPQIMDRLQQFVHGYAWHGVLAADGHRRRAWMSRQVACLSVADGGIGLPDVRAAFLRLSEQTVVRWSEADSPVAAAAGRVLLSCGTTSDSFNAASAFRLPAPSPRTAPTLAATGLAVLRNRNASPRSEPELTLLRQLLPATGHGPVTEKWWKRGWLHCRYDRQATIMRDLQRVQENHYGKFNAAVFAEAPLLRTGVLLQTTDAYASAADYSRLFQRDAIVKEVVEIEWVGKNHVRFRSCRDADALNNVQIMAFRRLCDTIVFNYPALLQPQNPTNVLQPRPPTEERWIVQPSHKGNVLICDQGGGASVSLGTVRSTTMATRVARTVNPALRRFDQHPSLDAFAPLWTRVPARGPRVHSSLAVPPMDPGIREVAARAERAVTADALIGSALAEVSWKRVARLPSSSSSQRLLFHKIKGLRLSGWDRRNERRGCPHCIEPTDDAGHAFHIMWTCPAAQTVWASHLLFWQRLGLWRDDDSRDHFVQGLFSLRVRQTPAAVWGFVDQRSVDVDAVEDVHAAIMVVWQQQVLGGMQRIWQWRHGVDDDNEPWSAAVAASAFRSSQVSAIHKAAQGARNRSSAIIGSICRGLLRVLTAAQPAMQTPVARVGRFLLFFDGGSRGNPGPGGAGAVVVHVDAFGSGARIVWSAAMSLANKKTNNNQAEYVGLVQGLKAAKTNQWKPLEVIGDSAMIITQLRDSRAPKHPWLRRYYARARILADTLGVAQWSHHVRAFNKMADAAANLAMDGRHSLQAFHPTARPEWAVLHEHLLGDVNQWRAYTHPGSSSIG